MAPMSGFEHKDISSVKVSFSFQLLSLLSLKHSSFRSLHIVLILNWWFLFSLVTLNGL